VILQIWPKGRELAKRFGAPGQAAD
jgi:hypothetical protein